MMSGMFGKGSFSRKSVAGGNQFAGQSGGSNQLAPMGAGYAGGNQFAGQFGNQFGGSNQFTRYTGDKAGYPGFQGPMMGTHGGGLGIMAAGTAGGIDNWTSGRPTAPAGFGGVPAPAVPQAQPQAQPPVGFTGPLTGNQRAAMGLQTGVDRNFIEQMLQARRAGGQNFATTMPRFMAEQNRPLGLLGNFLGAPY